MVCASDGLSFDESVGIFVSENVELCIGQIVVLSVAMPVAVDGAYCDWSECR